MEEALGVEDRLSESAFSGVSHGSDIMVGGIFSEPGTKKRFGELASDASSCIHIVNILTLKASKKILFTIKDAFE
jgi:hypothetical protein